MIRALSSVLALMLAAPSTAQTTQVSEFVSPCPNVFNYEPLTGEENKWYGTVNLTTDITLYALWLDIVLDNKANILGNWIGEVTTDDNIDFKIENTKQTITPEEPLGVRFFIQYKANDTIPKLKFIRFNGKEICQPEPPEVSQRIDTIKGNGYETRPTSSTARQQTTQYWYQTEKQQTTPNSLYWTQTTPAPTAKTTVKSQYWTERTTEDPRTTQKSQYWQQTTPTLKPVYWTEAVTESKAQTTVRTPGWSYVKSENNQKGTTTVKPTTQVWSRTQNTDRNRTVNSQAQSQSSSGNRYQTQNDNKKQTTVTPPIWPTVKVIVNQSVTAKEVLPIPPEIVVKQVGHTKYWSKIPTENITGAIWSASQDLQNEPYAKVSTQNQPKVTTPIYVRPEDRHTISGTRYEENRQPARPSVSYDQTNTDVIRPVKVQGESWSGEKTSSWSGDNYQTYVQPGGGSSGLQVDDYGSASGLPIFYIPNHAPQSALEPRCGKVLLNRGKNLNDESTLEGQWPWQVALYQQQTSVDFRYICGGTLVSKRHVITAAHCVTRRSSTRLVNKNTLTVYLGKHNLRNSVEGVQVKFVNKIFLNPEYDAINFKGNMAILELKDSVTFSERIQPVCLWPEYETALETVVGKTGSIVGWGFEATGAAREDLTQRQMSVVDQDTCIRSYVEFFRRFTSDKTYCAGYKDRTTVCNGDSGGGMVFQKGDSWYLRGVVSLSVATQGTYSCDPNHYVIFTDVAKFLPWIQDNIEDYI